MSATRYSAWIGEEHCIGVNVSYDALLVGVMTFTVRAAVARSADDSEWEHEHLRRNGLAALQLVHDDAAVWDDPAAFAAEFAEACREHRAPRFVARNELDPELYKRLDRDLCERWRRLGYQTPTLRADMKALFQELERDIADRANQARECVLTEFESALQESP